MTLEPDSREYWKEQADYWLAQFIAMNDAYQGLQNDYYSFQLQVRGIQDKGLTGPEKIKAAIKADRGGDAPTNVQGFA